MKNNKSHQPTESELEILQVLWEKGNATVREVYEILELTRDIGYTTTLKTMQIMTEKKLLDRDTSTRVHVYSPAIQQNAVEKNFLNKMKQSLFKGSNSRLVIGALNNSPLSQDELQEIKDFLKQFE